MGKGAEEGARLKAKFLRAVPALAKLLDALEAAFKERGHVTGLDGRNLYIGASCRETAGVRRWERSLHKRLNVLLQSAGAVVMKKALVILDEQLQALKLVPGRDYEFVLNVHDEFQIECLERHAEIVVRQARLAIIEAGKHFKLRCPLDGEAKVGRTWADTH